MSRKTGELLGWLAGQLHDAAYAAEQGGLPEGAIPLVLSIVLMRLSDDVASMVIKKTGTVDMPTMDEVRGILRKDPRIE